MGWAYLTSLEQTCSFLGRGEHDTKLSVWTVPSTLDGGADKSGCTVQFVSVFRSLGLKGTTSITLAVVRLGIYEGPYLAIREVFPNLG